MSLPVCHTSKLSGVRRESVTQHRDTLLDCASHSLGGRHSKYMWKEVDKDVKVSVEDDLIYFSSHSYTPL